MSDIFNYLSYSRELLFQVTVVSIAPAMLAVAMIFFLKLSRTPGIFEPIPISHKIAVIGLPGAGKTTLITGLFELIQRGVHVENVRIHGVKTIETVNQYVARLSSGEPIGPTKEKDIFVFRFSYVKRYRLLKRVYDVEVADFPGEYSEKISSSESGEDTVLNVQRSKKRRKKIDNSIEELQYTLFNKEFFSWIASAREYLFVIDISAIYSDMNARRAIAEITARIKTSWQVIEDATSERGIGSAKSRKVHVIFTKTDGLLSICGMDHRISELTKANPIIDEADRNINSASVRSMIVDALAANDLSTPTWIPEAILDEITTDNNRNFKDLLQFFRHRSHTTDIVYTSMVIETSDKTRLGIEQVLKATLP